MMQPLTYPLADETIQELQRLSALGYSLRDMAMYFNFDYRQFKAEADDPDSEVAYNIKRGKLILKANVDMRTAESAENGNITAVQQLAKSMREKNYNDLLNSLGDD